MTSAGSTQALFAVLPTRHATSYPQARMQNRGSISFMRESNRTSSSSKVPAHCSQAESPEESKEPKQQSDPSIICESTHYLPCDQSSSSSLKCHRPLNILAIIGTGFSNGRNNPDARERHFPNRRREKSPSTFRLHPASAECVRNFCPVFTCLPG